MTRRPTPGKPNTLGTESRGGDAVVGPKLVVNEIFGPT